MKLFLTGPINIGKTTAINRCLADYSGELWGFRSFKESAAIPGSGTIWFTEAAHPANRHIVAHIENYRAREFFPEVFAGPAVDILQKITPESRGIVVMDEIGFMESNTPSFQQEVERVLQLDIPVIGVLRQMNTPFLDKLAAWDRLAVIEVTPENRDNLPAQCKKLLGL